MTYLYELQVQYIKNYAEMNLVLLGRRKGFIRHCFQWLTNHHLSLFLSVWTEDRSCYIKLATLNGNTKSWVGQDEFCFSDFLPG